MKTQDIDVFEIERRAHAMHAEAIRAGSKAMAGWVRSHLSLRRPASQRS